jgi:sugar/nucleoside kinase (ribokinase family)
MSLVVVGSVAFDNVQTPTETRNNLLGGSGSYFSMAASLFGPVSIVSIVGDDWEEKHTQLLESHQIDTSGIQKVAGAKTFRWTGKYHENMNDRDTLDVQLNSFADFDPVLPPQVANSGYVFLANGPPAVQRRVLDQCHDKKLVVADTMDLWINTAREELLDLLPRIDGLVLNDSEAKLLTGQSNLIHAGAEIRKLGPKFVVVKKGEHGSIFFSDDETIVLPAYPTAEVVDPTGAGDSFGGGMMGYLAACDNFEPQTLRRSLAYGTLAASFTVEDFSLDRISAISRDDIEARMDQFRKMLSL